MHYIMSCTRISHVVTGAKLVLLFFSSSFELDLRTLWNSFYLVFALMILSIKITAFMQTEVTLSGVSLL